MSGREPGVMGTVGTLRAATAQLHTLVARIRAQCCQIFFFFFKEKLEVQVYMENLPIF